MPLTPPQVLDQIGNDPDVLKGVDIDKAYGDQCWDLVELYAEKLGVPKEPWSIPLGPQISAKEAWTYYDQSPHMQKYFDKVPAGRQQKGDIMVYDGHGAYTEGHIAICVNGNTVFEQNADPDGSLPHVATRASTYLLGALRLKGVNIMSQDTQIANARGDRLKQIATLVNVPDGDDQTAIVKGIQDLESIAQLRGDRLHQIADLLGLEDGDDQPAIVAAIQKQGNSAGMNKSSVLDYLSKNLK